MPAPRAVADPLAGHGPLGRRDGRLVIAEWSIVAPAGDGDMRWMAPPHRHRDDDEAWYVLSGRLAVMLDGETVTVGAGGAVVADAGVVHTFANPGPGPCRHLIVMTPRIAALIEALHAGPVDDPAALWARFGSERVI